MTLSEKRKIFSKNVAKLINFINETEYDCAIDEAKRAKEQALIYAKLKKGIVDSQHIKGLAVDIILYLGKKYIKTKEDYLLFGLYWQSLHILNRWGGNWDKDKKYFESGEYDAGHFEMMG